MAWCASCGLQLSGADALCPHHVWGEATTWSRNNRAMCAFVHRKQPLVRLSERERERDDDGVGG